MHGGTDEVKEGMREGEEGRRDGMKLESFNERRRKKTNSRVKQNKTDLVNWMTLLTRRR